MLAFLEKKGQTLGPTAPFKAESCTAENVPQHREASASPQSTGTCLLQPFPLSCLRWELAGHQAPCVFSKEQSLVTGSDLCLCG